MQKKISVIIAVISMLFTSIMGVKAESEGKLYEISLAINGVKENKEVYNGKYSMSKGKIKIDKEDINIESLGKADYIRINNYGAFSLEINLTISGDTTLEAFDWTGYIGKINIKGSGSLKFKPVSGVGTKEIPTLEFGGVPRYYVEDASKQKEEVAQKIVTSLPITYEKGYVCINCKTESTTKKTTIPTTVKRTTTNSSTTTTSTTTETTITTLKTTTQSERIEDVDISKESIPKFNNSLLYIIGGIVLIFILGLLLIMSFKKK